MQQEKAGVKDYRKTPRRGNNAWIKRGVEILLLLLQAYRNLSGILIKLGTFCRIT